MRKTLPIVLLFSFSISGSFAQLTQLQQQMTQLLATKKATVGVSLYKVEGGDSLSIHNGIHYPLQSVFKFHIALTVLHQVDKGRYSLSQKTFVHKSELLPNTWSPLRDKYPNGNVALSLDTILKYTVAFSDNNGCDILLRLLGGATTVNDYIHSLGITDVSIEVNEAEAHKAWEVQYRNWTTPTAATQLLYRFFQGNILSAKSYNFLLNIMAGTLTGQNRLKGQLPSGTRVAHKTGTSDTNEQGVTAAINDIGIIYLPNGRHLLLSVFVSNSRENNETNEKIVADIAKLAWDYFTKP